MKEQAKKCSFDDLHDSLVKDRIIVGLKFSKLVPQLLNDDLSLQKTIELCRNHELTTKQSQSMIGEDKVEVIRVKKNAMKKKPERKQEREFNENLEECNKCGWKHKSQYCPAANKECHKCKGKGHFAAMCKSMRKAGTFGKPKVHIVQEGDTESESEEELFIGAVETVDDGEDWYESVKVNNRKISVKLDTGAHCNVLPLWMVEKLNLMTLEPSNTIYVM